MIPQVQSLTLKGLPEAVRSNVFEAEIDSLKTMRAVIQCVPLSLLASNQLAKPKSIKDILDDQPNTQTSKTNLGRIQGATPVSSRIRFNQCGWGDLNSHDIAATST